MAVRIQVRRGTTTQWNDADPVLNEGEIGYNVTLASYKIGDGSTIWSELDYFPTMADLDTSLGDYIALAEKGAADGVAELDTNENVLTKTGVVFEGTTVDSYQTTLQVTDPVSDITLTLPSTTGTIALTTDITVTPSSTTTFTNKTLTSPVVTGLVISDSSIIFEGATANEYETTFQITDPTADRTITFPDDTGTVALASQLSSYAPLAGATFTGAISGTDLTLSGNLTVNGTTTTIDTTHLQVEDKNIVLGYGSTSDAAVDGGGITLTGATNKTFNWVDATDAWTSSEHMNLVSGKSYKINNTAISAALPALTWGEVKNGKSGLVIS